MKLLDSRRMTGPNLLWDLEGAVLDVALSEEEGPLIRAWLRQASRVLEAVGWGAEELCVRRYPGGASLGLSARIDRLHAATGINEWAWEAAVAAAEGREPSDAEVTEAARKLRRSIEWDEDPELVALWDAAARRRVPFLWDAGQVTLGLGAGSITWHADDLPAPRDVPWHRVSEIPVVLVAGCRGTATTARLLAVMVRAAGVVAGIAADRIEVGDEVLEERDGTGPEGARALLRDRRVELAILETANAGILRQGLGIARADAAAVIQASAGEAAEIALVAARAVKPQGRVVLNADDPELASRTGWFGAPAVWFSLNPDRPGFDDLLVAGLAGCTVEDGELVRYGEERRQVVARLAEVPLTRGGDRQSLENALAAVALGGAVGLPVDAMSEGLRAFPALP